MAASGKTLALAVTWARGRLDTDRISYVPFSHPLCALHGQSHPVMELIETQASDLRYLAQAPVALRDSASVSYDTQQASPPDSSSAPAGDASTAKRKPVDDGGPADGQRQTRSKRNRMSEALAAAAGPSLRPAMRQAALLTVRPRVQYISIAW